MSREQIYRRALEGIANPIKEMQDAADIAGVRINGMDVMQLANDAGHLRDKAKRALDEAEVEPRRTREQLYRKIAIEALVQAHDLAELIGDADSGQNSWQLKHQMLVDEGLREFGLDLASARAEIGPDAPAPEPYEMTIREAQAEAFSCAVQKGWHEDDDKPVTKAVHDIALAGIRIAAICDEIEDIRKGHETQQPTRPMTLRGTTDRQKRVICWLALHCTEAAEAMDDVLVGRIVTTISDIGRPQGLGSELVDGIIRALDTASALGIDVETELRRKFKYNRTREHRHGKKRA